MGRADQVSARFDALDPFGTGGTSGRCSASTRAGPFTVSSSRQALLLATLDDAGNLLE